MKQPIARKPRRKSQGISSEPNPMGASGAAADLSDGGQSDNNRPRIADLAYQLYERRGRHDGHDWEDWFTAEQLVIAGRGSTEDKREIP